MNITIKRLNPRRNIFEISGAEGSGKTTFMRMLGELTSHKVAHVDGKFFNSPFHTGELEGVGALFIDELNPGDVCLLKELESGHTMASHKKGDLVRAVPNEIKYIFYTAADVVKDTKDTDIDKVSITTVGGATFNFAASDPDTLKSMEGGIDIVAEDIKGLIDAGLLSRPTVPQRTDTGLDKLKALEWEEREDGSFHYPPKVSGVVPPVKLTLRHEEGRDIAWALYYEGQCVARGERVADIVVSITEKRIAAFNVWYEVL